MPGPGQPDCRLVWGAAVSEGLGCLRDARLQCLQAVSEWAGCWPKPLIAGLQQTELWSLQGELTVRVQVQQQLLLAEQVLAQQRLQAC